MPFFSSLFNPLLLGGKEASLAGAEGLEPSPSALTVRCPTDWTTPQRAVHNIIREQALSGECKLFVLFCFAHRRVSNS